MKSVVEIGDAGVVAIHGEEILGQVVAADGQEIHAAGHGARLVHGRRHLHHHAHQGHGRVDALLADLAVAAAQELEGLLEFRHVAHHGQEYAQVAEARVGLEHRTQLGEENLRMVQGHAYAAPAQEGIRFLDGEVGQGLVTPDIQGAHRDGVGREGLELLAVNLALLFLGRKTLAHEEGNFGAVQAHALGAALQGTGDVCHEPRVHPQRDALIVGRHAGQTAQRLEIAIDLVVLVGDLAKATQDRRGRIQVDIAVVAVHHDRHVAQARVGKVHGAHDRGNAHGAGEDGHVRIAGAADGNQSGDALPGYLPEHRCGQLLAYEYRLLRVLLVLALLGLEIAEHTLAEIFHIHRALAQVRMLHRLEVTDVFDHDLGERSLGPLAGLDEPGYLAANRRVIQDAQVNVEEGEVFRAELVAQAFRHRFDIDPHPRKGALEGPQLTAAVVALLARYGVEIGHRRHHDGGADADTLRTGDAADTRVDGIALRAAFHGHVARDQRVRDDPGELRRERDQEGLFALVEAPALRLLHHQYAQYVALVNDGHAQESVERLLTDIRQELEVGMLFRILQVDRLFALGDQSHQTFPQGQGRLVDLVRVQPFGCAEHKALQRPIMDIDAADFRPHRHADARDDNAQDAVEGIGRVQFQDNVAQNLEHQPAPASTSLSSGGASSRSARR